MSQNLLSAAVEIGALRVNFESNLNTIHKLLIIYVHYHSLWVVFFLTKISRILIGLESIVLKNCQASNATLWRLLIKVIMEFFVRLRVYGR